MSDLKLTFPDGEIVVFFFSLIFSLFLFAYFLIPEKIPKFLGKLAVENEDLDDEEEVVIDGLLDEFSSLLTFILAYMLSFVGGGGNLCFQPCLSLMMFCFIFFIILSSSANFLKCCNFNS